MPRILAALLLAAAAAAAEPVIKAIPEQPYVAVKWSGATDLSGITWVKDDLFYVVSNKTEAIFPALIKVDRATGKIAEPEFGQRIRVSAGCSDFEGIAWLAGLERFYISSESQSAIIGTDTEGDAIFRLKVPRIFREARENKGLESLTWNEQAAAMWTANEDALEPDGGQSDESRGALVRLQKFNDKFEPVAQFAYRTETSLVRITGRGTGVTDLCLLPDGQLLVLERVMTVGLGVRIFRVELEGATDTSAERSLKKAEGIVPVKKHLLYERSTAVLNFEGIALGPALEDGSRLLLLVADNGGDTTHHFMPLKLRMTAAEEK